jgi:hypothetical protein
MSLIDTQTSIEYMYDRNKIPKMIQKDIADTPELMELINKCYISLQSVYLMGPHFNQKNQYLSSINPSVLLNTIYRVLEVIMVLPDGTTFSSIVGQSAGAIKSVDTLSSFKIVSSVIAYMSYHGLIKIIRAGDANSGMMEVIPTYVCDQRILKFIKESMYLPPMVCAPEILTHNKSSGYKTITNDSVILKSYNHHDGNVCLDSLNKFNQVALSLDIKMLTTFDEQPKKLIDTPEKQKQFDKLREDSYHVYKLLIQTGNNFHLTHKVDKRGRTYCCGYNVSTQGNSFRKAIINLAKKELVFGNFL